MSTTKKWTRRMIFGLAFGLIVNAGFAQEQVAKAANVTEVVNAAEVVSASVVKEVKPVVVVPETLAKAMVTGKVAKVQTYERWYNVTVTGNPNMPSGLTVTGPSIPEPPANGECALLNEGNPCAVKLTVNSEGYTFGSSSYTLNALPAGATLPGSPQYAKHVIENN